jgi:hypothetical protein
LFFQNPPRETGNRKKLCLSSRCLTHIGTEGKATFYGVSVALFLYDPKTASINMKQSSRKNIYTQYRNAAHILFIGILTIAAFFMRMGYVEQTVIVNPIRADARQYVIYGYNLLHHQVFSSQMTKGESPRPDSFRSPGYPLLIMLAFYFGGEKGFYPLMITWQVLIGSLMVPLTFFISICIMPAFWALAAATLVCFSPHLISMTSYLLTETLFGFTFLAAVSILLLAIIRRNAVLFALAGCSFGVAYLVNETVMLLPFLLSILLWISFKGLLKFNILKSSHSKIAVFTLVFVCFPLGWSIRNHINILEDSNRGSQRALSTLSHGAYPGFIYENPAYKYFPYREDPRQPEFSSSISKFTAILWDRVKERPLRYLSWYLIEKPYYFWSWNILQGQGDVYVYPVTTSFYMSSTAANVTRTIIKCFHPFLMTISLIGLIIFFTIPNKLHASATNTTAASLFSLILIYYTLLYTVFAPWPRYSVPFRPFFYVWAIWSIKSIISILAKK